MKLKRGQKQCGGCSAIVGARTKVCGSCGHKFLIKKGRGTTGKKYQIADWRLLEKGDRIRCKQGSGPYFVNYSGDKTYTTERGTYEVMFIKDDGIHAWGPSGRTFLYMGTLKESKFLPSYYQAPHKITYSKDHFSNRS